MRNAASATLRQRPETAPARGLRGPRALWIAGTAAAAAAGMFCYLRVAGTVPVLSDGAGDALQAWDMLHGNLLLHGWWATDVSFYTTELPQYMLVEAVAGLRPEVVHICAAMTYALLVLLAAFVARGRARGPEGLVRALLAAGIMLAPEPGAPAWILLSDPDHVGTGVPVLLALLLLDAAKPRWYVPVAAGAVLAWSIAGDPLVLVVGAGPLALAAAARACRVAWSRRETGLRQGLRAAWYEVSVAAAAVAAVPAALAADRLLRDLGGFSVNQGASGVLPLSAVGKNVPLTGQGLLALFGADFAAAHGALEVAFAIVHLAGVALVLTAVIVAAGRLVRPRGWRAGVRGGAGVGAGVPGDLVADVLVIAVVANVAAYLAEFRITNIYAAHDMGPVLALGAALAGRVLGGPLLRARPGRISLVPAAAAGLACYAAMLGFAAAGGQAPPDNASLAAWLTGHDLRSGLAGYWQGTSVTLDSGGGIDMVAVVPDRSGRLAPRHWEADMRLADPATHAAGFLVLVPGGPPTPAQALATFGRPARVYRYQGYTIMVWHQNLLRRLGPPVN